MVPQISYDDFIPTPAHHPNVATPLAPASPGYVELPSQQPISIEDSPAVEVRSSPRAVQKPRWMNDFVTAAVHSSHTKKLHYPAAHQGLMHILILSSKHFSLPWMFSKTQLHFKKQLKTNNGVML